MGEALVFGLFLLAPCALGGLIVGFVRHERNRGTQASWGRLVLGNLLGLLFLVSLLFVGGEGYYRFIYDTTDALDYTKVSERWVRRHWHLNSAGCRDNINYSPAIKAGARRVTFVGDSFTAGHGIKEVENRFGNRIRRAHPEWEVHLLAQPGFDTGAEVMLIEKALGKGYQLDQVVLVYCLNDVSDILPEWGKASAQIYAEVDNSGWLRRNSYFVNTLYHRLAVRRNPYLKKYFEFVRDGYRGAVWERQKQRLKAFRDLVAGGGGQLSVVTFPFFDELGPNYEYQFVHDELNQFWRELGVPHLDLLPVYKKLPASRLRVNHFDAHPNEYAHQLAAEVIDKFLREQLASKP
jgi:hypothetical protein